MPFPPGTSATLSHSIKSVWLGPVGLSVWSLVLFCLPLWMARQHLWQPTHTHAHTARHSTIWSFHFKHTQSHTQHMHLLNTHITSHSRALCFLIIIINAAITRCGFCGYARLHLATHRRGLPPGWRCLWLRVLCNLEVTRCICSRCKRSKRSKCICSHSDVSIAVSMYLQVYLGICNCIYVSGGISVAM